MKKITPLMRKRRRTKPRPPREGSYLSERITEFFSESYVKEGRWWFDSTTTLKDRIDELFRREFPENKPDTPAKS